jgi:hypothetical protein
MAGNQVFNVLKFVSTRFEQTRTLHATSLSLYRQSVPSFFKTPYVFFQDTVSKVVAPLPFNKIPCLMIVACAIRNFIEQILL